MRPPSEVVNDADVMNAFGNTLVLWDFHARKPRQLDHLNGEDWEPKKKYKPVPYEVGK